jgi:hypothetical protein
MTTTIVFDLLTQLVETFDAAAPVDAIVYDGQGDSDDPGNFLMVGVDDPYAEGAVDSASGTQEWAGLGQRAAYEHGDAVWCCALARSGDSGSDAQRAAREAVRDLVAGVDATLKADPNLGGKVPGLMWVRYGRNFTLKQVSDSNGVEAIFSFSIAYEARLV